MSLTLDSAAVAGLATQVSGSTPGPQDARCAEAHLNHNIAP
jgi:hypothetical protein